MNYIAQLNCFFDSLQSNYYSSTAQLLYHTLLMINNKCGWIDWFQRTNQSICDLTGMSENTLKRARNELKQLELIDFIQATKKGQITKYKIIMVSKCGVENDTIPDTIADTIADTQTADINKLKLKLKHNKKENVKEKYFADEKINKSFCEWLEYKKQKKEKYTEMGLKKLISQINNQLKKHNSNEIINLIDTCISRNYKGIIFDMLKSKKEENIKEIEDWLNE